MEATLDKAAARREMKAALKAADPADLARWDREAARTLLDLACFREAELILSYAPFGREFDADLLNREILARGKRLALPLVTGEGRMEARLVEDLAALVSGAYGIREPGPTTQSVSPEAIDLLILPGLAFDPDCFRMGRGGGYYDRYLAIFPGLTVAPTRELQILPAVPRDPWDRAADMVVTEARTFCRKALMNTEE